VTFSSQHAYLAAIEAQFVEIKTSKFQKTVQIDPFLEEAACGLCEVARGPYFCRDKLCFRYFCRSCWQVRFIGGGGICDSVTL
jgi:cytoplasmic polyadenylation element-binding protein